jgi:RNA polymerase sigma-70 factor (ECF subfamily)
VLVVEDDPAIREMVVEVLAGEGYRAVPAPDGATALAILDGAGPALGAVLLDLRLPDMDGRTLAARLRARPPGAPPLIVFTAAPPAEAAADAVALGAAGFVTKPFDLDVLLDVVARCLAPPPAAAAPPAPPGAPPAGWRPPAGKDAPERDNRRRPLVRLRTEVARRRSDDLRLEPVRFGEEVVPPSVPGWARPGRLAVVPCGPPPAGRAPDHVLVARVSAHDAAGADALATLYDRYAASVYGLGRRLLRDDGAAEELLQETFWRLWAQAGRYAPDRGRLSTWLLRIATNLALDARRRAARRPTAAAGTAPGHAGTHRDGPAPEEPEDPDRSVPEQVWLAELRRVLVAGLDRLPPAQRRAVELVYVGGYTHAASAGRLGVPCSTLKTQLALGLRKLAAHLEPLGLRPGEPHGGLPG